MFSLIRATDVFNFFFFCKSITHVIVYNNIEFQVLKHVTGISETEKAIDTNGEQ